jgi:hypothetical protein
MRPAKVVAVILALIPASAQAAPFSWDNPGGGNFNNFLNWSPIGVPGATDTAAFDELGITSSLLTVTSRINRPRLTLRSRWDSFPILPPGEPIR